MSEELRKRLAAWAAEDPDPLTRGNLLAALEREDKEEIRAAGEAPLRFGTAGLRGAVGAGPARMNLLVVLRLAWALAEYLKRSDLAGRGVVIGFDARPDSARFAEKAAEVLSGAGVRAWVSTEACPTPVIAFGVRHLRAGAGLVVTASHNPRADNGCKVYDSDGIQIISPWDDEIAARMEATPPTREIPCSSALVAALPESTISAYYQQLAKQAGPERKQPGPGSALKVAYSPLHGVGLASVRRALASSGATLLPTPGQSEPDGSFPTLAFPNPEEPGALDELLASARQHGAALAIANDPDADRVALALPDGQGGFERLSGDALGLLFASALLEEREAGGTSQDSPVLVSTVVSSPALEVLAARRGAEVRRTLTGFKWLCRVALLEPTFLFAYEEALGYCFRAPEGHVAPLDKDGIAGAVRIVRMLQEAGSGAALHQRLVALYGEVGYWASLGQSVRFEGAESTARQHEAMERLRRGPPRSIAGLRVKSQQDYLLGAQERPNYLGAQNLLQFDLDGGHRILVRPSGTEPKVKIYAHVHHALKHASEFPAVRRAARERAGAVAAELRQSLVAD